MTFFVHVLHYLLYLKCNHLLNWPHFFHTELLTGRLECLWLCHGLGKYYWYFSNRDSGKWTLFNIKAIQTQDSRPVLFTSKVHLCNRHSVLIYYETHLYGLWSSDLSITYAQWRRPLCGHIQEMMLMMSEGVQ